MKAIVTEKEVLVKIHAAAINAGDCFSMRGSPWVVRFMVGFPKPRKDYILGWDRAALKPVTLSFEEAAASPEWPCFCTIYSIK